MADLTADDVRVLRNQFEENANGLFASMCRALPALLDAWDEREEAWTTLGVSKEGREENDDPDVETLAQSIGIAMQYERDMREQAEGVAKELRARLTEAENKNEALRAARAEVARLREALERIVNECPALTNAVVIAHLALAEEEEET